MNSIFISYSHDSDGHRNSVRTLAEQLRGNGYRVTTDLDVGDPPQGWARWMEEQLPIASRVLMVFTATYRNRYDGTSPAGIGRGVAWEAHLIRNMLYETVPVNDRFRAVIFVEDDARHIPLLLRSHNHYLIPQGLDSLCRWIDGMATAATTQPTSTAEPALSHETRNGVLPFQEAGGLGPGDLTYVKRSADRELAALFDDQGSYCVAINGDYGIGKTSLLNQVPSLFGQQWFVIRPIIADLRADSAKLCVPHILEAFAPLAGRVVKPSALRDAFVKRPALLLFDDFGEMQEEGLNAILPMLMDLAAESAGRFRIIVTLPTSIRTLLKMRGMLDPKRQKPWREVTVLPFEERDLRRLLRLMPETLARDVETRIELVKRHTQLHPKRLRIMLNQLTFADPRDYCRIIESAATNDQ